MNIRVENIKCHELFENTLPSSGIVLLDGPSGSGKSTILNCILFALYNKGGTKIVGKIVGNEVSKIKPCVMLTGENYKIIRAKNPNRLQLILPGREMLIDDEAQAWINQNIFATFVDQHGFDSFLISSGNDRMKKLESMAGFEDDTLHRFESSLLINKKNFESRVVESALRVNMLNDELSQKPVGIGSLENFEHELSQLESRRVELLVKQRSIEQYIKQKAMSDKHDALVLERAELILSTLGHDDRRVEYTKMCNALRRDEIAGKIKNIDQKNLESKVQDALLQQSKFLDYKKNKKRYLDTISKLSELDPLTVTKCPHVDCSKPIEICGDVLTAYLAFDDENENSEKRVINRGRRKRTLQENRDLQEALLLVDSTCDQNNEPSVTETDIKKYKVDLDTFYRCSFELQKIGECIDYKFLDLKVFKSKIDEDVIMLKRLNNINCEIGALRDICMISEQGESEASTASESTASESTVATEIDENQKLYDKMKSRQMKNLQSKEYTNLSLRIADESKVMGTRVEDKRQIFILNACWLESKTLCIEQVVETLQIKVGNIATKLFENPIAITVSCWKGATKTRGEIVGFEISININNRMTSVCELSGGEKSRVSIAFSCALAEMQGSSLLMLDESLSGLGIGDLTKTTGALKEWSIKNEIVVVIVCHGAIKGLFDKVICI